MNLPFTATAVYLRQGTFFSPVLDIALPSLSPSGFDLEVEARRPSTTGTLRSRANMSAADEIGQLPAAPAALVQALEASLQSYDKLIESTMKSQNNAAAALEAVLTCLQDVHRTAPPVGLREDGTLVQEDAFEQYAQKVIELRKRMHTVSTTLKKAQNRLHSLQTAVTKHEMRSMQR